MQTVWKNHSFFSSHIVMTAALLILDRAITFFYSCCTTILISDFRSILCNASSFISSLRCICSSLFVECKSFNLVSLLFLFWNSHMRKGFLKGIVFNVDTTAMNENMIDVSSKIDSINAWMLKGDSVSVASEWQLHSMEFSKQRIWMDGSNPSTDNSGVILMASRLLVNVLAMYHSRETLAPHCSLKKLCERSSFTQIHKT